MRPLLFFTKALLLLTFILATSANLTFAQDDTPMSQEEINRLLEEQMPSGGDEGDYNSDEFPVEEDPPPAPEPVTPAPQEEQIQEEQQDFRENTGEEEQIQEQQQDFRENIEEEQIQEEEQQQDFRENEGGEGEQDFRENTGEEEQIQEEEQQDFRENEGGEGEQDFREDNGGEQDFDTQSEDKQSQGEGEATGEEEQENNESYREEDNLGGGNSGDSETVNTGGKGESPTKPPEKDQPKKEKKGPPEGLPPIVDGAYEKMTGSEKIPLKYDHLREADIFWEKRIWRVIDTRQKMNLAFSNPKEPLITVLLEAIRSNPKVRIYMEDYFESYIDTTELGQKMGSVDTILVTDPETYEETMEIVNNDFDWTSVKKFRLKEDWIFDEESSKMITRIIGIAPIRDVIDEQGNYRGQEAMFWAYYPDLREDLAKNEVFRGFNNAQKLSWDDVLNMRFFSSFIMKESNPYDRRIKDYAAGRDALLESERVKDELFKKEHDLWSN